MTIKEALSDARNILAGKDIDDSLLESELLLRHTLKIGRVRLYLELERELGPEEKQTFRHLINRRLNLEPVAYITGHREFYGLDFYVDSSVLIPRPESELLVEKALERAQCYAAPSIADIGTGCGAIAVSLALNLPHAEIYATDISAAALRIAGFNCQKHGVADRVFLLNGDMLTPLPEPVDIIVANLPYLAEAELSRTVTLDFEPSLALNGGGDGLDKIRRLCRQTCDKLLPGGCLFLEVGQGQSRTVKMFLHELFPSAEIGVTPDLSGIDRVVSLTLR